MKFRVKEFNSAYDPYFGEGKGWIFCTNELTFYEALIFILYQKMIRNSCLSYEITPMIWNVLDKHINLNQ